MKINRLLIAQLLMGLASSLGAVPNTDYLIALGNNTETPKYFKVSEIETGKILWEGTMEPNSSTSMWNPGQKIKGVKEIMVPSSVEKLQVRVYHNKPQGTEMYTYMTVIEKEEISRLKSIDLTEYAGKDFAIGFLIRFNDNTHEWRQWGDVTHGVASYRH